MAVLALIAVGIFIYSTCSDGAGCACRPIDNTLPDVSTAPYSVTTKTHLYYAVLAEQNPDGLVTMRGWYEKSGDSWEFHNDEIKLTPVLKPVITRR